MNTSALHGSFEFINFIFLLIRKTGLGVQRPQDLDQINFFNVGSISIPLQTPFPPSKQPELILSFLDKCELRYMFHQDCDAFFSHIVQRTLNNPDDLISLMLEIRASSEQELIEHILGQEYCRPSDSAAKSSSLAKMREDGTVAILSTHPCEVIKLFGNHLTAAITSHYKRRFLQYNQQYFAGISTLINAQIARPEYQEIKRILGLKATYGDYFRYLENPSIINQQCSDDFSSNFSI